MTGWELSPNTWPEFFLPDFLLNRSQPSTIPITKASVGPIAIPAMAPPERVVPEFPLDPVLVADGDPVEDVIVEDVVIDDICEEVVDEDDTRVELLVRLEVVFDEASNSASRFILQRTLLVLWL